VPDPKEATLRVCALYPDLMNIYADRGNLLMLERRCAWRGIGFELGGVGLEDPLDPDAADLFYVGGGQDRRSSRSVAAISSSGAPTRSEARCCPAWAWSTSRPCARTARA